MPTLTKYEQGHYNLIEKSLGEKKSILLFLSLRLTYPLTPERGEGAKPYKNPKILSS
jgi:hypothetical protein